MKLAIKLAYKNLTGAGLRTWLNVIVLSFAFVVIIFFNGLMDGWDEQSKKDTIAWQYGYGDLLHPDYDPFDPFTLQDGHGILTDANGNLVPMLIRQATIYPDGRMLSISLNGIDASQTIVKLPTQKLTTSSAAIPAIIGKRMAKAAKLSVGDEVLLRWRDKNGTFDAGNITIVSIFDTTVGTVDSGQIWIPISTLWNMTGLHNHATKYIIANENYAHANQWKYRNQEELLKEITKMIAMKKVSGSIMYIMLLAIALLAIFDTQVLSIFRRQKEIGTYIALGMTRLQVVKLFTVEGSMYSILGSIVGCIYGIPLFIYISKKGIGMPEMADEMGMAIAERIFPVYGVGLVLSTILLVVISATIVSFLPARKITKMDPVHALKGKLQ